ncbi:MAG: lamin tail domain-containing protein [Calditrichaeota bacterium]|nr:lamin tail domain-containing protein [Calditrichota bacterium]
MKKLSYGAAFMVAAWLLAGALYAQSAILLNEVYSRGTNENPDWIELYNASSQTVDITGFKIYDSGGKAGTKPKKEFPAGTVIPPLGVYVVVTEDGTASAFGLSSSGETVWLEDATGAVIDTVAFPALATTESYGRYPDGGPWQILKRVTRGSLNGVLRMNEIYSRGTTSDPDWIEVYNATLDTVDISGYKIYDNGGKAGTKPKKLLPAGTVLPPHGFFVIVTDNTGDPADFGLSSSGEWAWLEDADGVVIDSVAFPAMDVTQSYSRVPDGGPWELVSVITRGGSNGSPVRVAEQPAVLGTYHLSQNYPNPFNPTTYVDVYLPSNTHVSMVIFNALGQKVKEVVNAPLAAGSHRIVVDGSDLPSGVYLYRLQAGEFTATRRMVLLK